MNPNIQRAEFPPRAAEGLPVSPSSDQDAALDPEFDPLQWTESSEEHSVRTAGGRTVLGYGLALLALLWTAYTAWSAGRALAGTPLTSPAIAQWIAVAAGPLALLGLGWLMFGRTRRREAERFTRSVVAMRTEARSLEALLSVLSERIGESHSALRSMTEGLMRLGDETTARLGGVTRELDISSDRLARTGEATDRAAEAARNDMAVLLNDLPEAEAAARSMSEQLVDISRQATQRGIHAEEAGQRREACQGVLEPVIEVRTGQAEGIVVGQFHGSELLG